MLKEIIQEIIIEKNELDYYENDNGMTISILENIISDLKKADQLQDEMTSMLKSISNVAMGKIKIDIDALLKKYKL